MGLFTKFFSREGEGPKDGEDQDPEEQPGDNPQGAAAKPEDLVANTSDANDPRARNPGSTTAEPARAPAPQPAVVVTQSVALGKSPATAGNKLGAGAAATRPGSSPKREMVVGAPKVPSALGSTQAGTGPNIPPLPASAPDAASGGAANKKVSPNPQTSRAQPRKHTPAAGTRTNPTTVPLGTDVLVRRPIQIHPNPPGAPAGPERQALPLEAAVDAALSALTDPNRPRPNSDGPRERDSDHRAVAATFADLAKVHAEPLRELMFQISLGRTPGSWAAACRPVLRPLLDAAAQIEMLELVGALGAFDASLERASAEPTTFIGDAASDSLRAAYEHLRQQLPDAFGQPPKSDSRRMIVLETLLLQVPEMQRRTLERLYAAGLNSLGQLSRARPEELSAVAGIDRELAAAIILRVQNFERERSRVHPNGQRKHIQDRLRTVIERLAQLQTDFERAEQESSTQRKRSARRDREAAVLELDLLFAELGEIDFIEELKRCPVRRKIQRVASYLEEQQTTTA